MNRDRSHKKDCTKIVSEEIRMNSCTSEIGQKMGADRDHSMSREVSVEEIRTWGRTSPETVMEQFDTKDPVSHLSDSSCRGERYGRKHIQPQSHEKR